MKGDIFSYVEEFFPTVSAAGEPLSIKYASGGVIVNQIRVFFNPPKI